MDSVTSVSPDVSAVCYAERRCEWVVSESGGTLELIKVLEKFPHTSPHESCMSQGHQGEHEKTLAASKSGSAMEGFGGGSGEEIEGVKKMICDCVQPGKWLGFILLAQDCVHSSGKAQGVAFSRVLQTWKWDKRILPTNANTVPSLGIKVSRDIVDL